MNSYFLTSHFQLFSAYWFDERNYEGIMKFFKVSLVQNRKRVIQPESRPFSMEITSLSEAIVPAFKTSILLLPVGNALSTSSSSFSKDRSILLSKIKGYPEF